MTQVKKGGGITFNATTKLTILNERIVYQILHDYKIFNADVMIREDCTVDDFIDVVLGNRKYLRCIYVSAFLIFDNVHNNRLRTKRWRKSTNWHGDRIPSWSLAA